MYIIVYSFSTLPQNTVISSELLENYNVFSSPITSCPGPMWNVILRLQKYFSKGLLSHNTIHIAEYISKNLESLIFFILHIPDAC